MSVTGKFSEFNEDVEELENYLERFDLYVKANAVKDGDKVPLFLTVIGPKIYSVLKNLVLPNKVAEQTYDDLVKTLKAHYTPEKSIIAQRCKFHKRFQKEGETLSQYAVEIKQLASSCDFGTFLNDALRDRFVSGIRSEEIQHRLMTEKEANFSSLFELASRLEAAKTEVRNFHTHGEVGEVDFVKHKYRPKSGTSKNVPNKSFQNKQSDNFQSNNSSLKCFRCGKPGHHGNRCNFRNATCYSCGKIGHLAPVCKSKGQKTNNAGKNFSNKSKVNFVDETEENDIEDCYELNNISVVNESMLASNSYYTTMLVEGKEVKMIIDTGASMTCMPKHVYVRQFNHINLNHTELQLKSYSGHALELMGEFDATVRHEGKDFRLPVIVVNNDDERQPVLLGRNWLKHLKLDWNRIFQVGPENSGKCLEKINKNDTALNLEKSLKVKYTDVFEGPVGVIKGVSTEIVIDEEATPIFCKSRPVPYAMKEQVEKEIDRLVKSDIIYPVKSSNWATPLVCVNKPDGKSVRLCGDYKVTLNRVLKNKEHYPLPVSEDIFAKLSGAKVFSKIDLTSAYLQLRVSEHSQQFLTVNTHLGLYRYKRLPFGITSSPFQFQAAMDNILKGLEDTYCFLDDILVVGHSLEDGAKKTERLLMRLQEFGIRANPQKSELLKYNLEFLGHRIDEEGIHPTEKRVKAVLDAPQPTDITQLRAYLGMLNFYGKFLPNLASELYPLYKLLRKDEVWCWNTQCAQAFEKSKVLLTNSKVLVPYNPKLKIELSCDASAYGIASVMSHIMADGSARPVAYASRTLSKAEKNYAQLDKEALAAIFGVKKFHKYLYGQSFTLVTDHAPLTTLLGEKKPIPAQAAARMVRWAIILSAYNYTIVHRRGTEIVEADALSRLPKQSAVEWEDHDTIKFFAPFPDVPLTSVEIEKATRLDSLYSKVLDMTQVGWPEHMDRSDPLHPFFIRKNELSVELGCILWGSRVVIPPSLQEIIIKMLHEEHPGICKMKSLARSYVWWPNLDNRIEHVVKSCSVCQMTRKSIPKAPLHPWPWATRKWQRVHIDFGQKHGTYFLILIDSYSKWVEVFPMAGTNATKTIEKLRTCFSAYGVPENIVSDGGPPFRSQEFEGFLSSNGINHLFSPPYHPASNGQVESMVGIFKTALLKQILHDDQKGTKRTLQHKLDCFLFSYRNTPHSITNKTPSELFLGFKPRTRFTFLKPHLPSRMETKQLKVKEWCDRKRGPERSFVVGQPVMVKSVRQEEVKWMPGMIIRVISPVTYIVSVMGQKRFVHADHLKESEFEVNVKPSEPEITSPPRYEKPILITPPVETKQQSPANSSPVKSNTSPPPRKPSPIKPPLEEPSTETLRKSGRTRKAPQRLDL